MACNFDWPKKEKNTLIVHPSFRLFCRYYKICSEIKNQNRMASFSSKYRKIILEDHYYYYKWGLIGVLSNYRGPIKDTKRTRGRLDRNVAPCSRPTTNVIGPLHECKKVCPCTKALPQSGCRAWIKQGRRKRKKRGRETEARRLMEKKGKTKTHLRN